MTSVFLCAISGRVEHKSMLCLQEPHLACRACEEWQQSILKSTSLAATTKRLGGNKLFLVQLRKSLIVNGLLQEGRIFSFALSICCCETRQTECRNLVFRASIYGLSRCGWVGIATWKMANGERATKICVAEHRKNTISLSISTKIATQLLHQNITQNVLR